MDNEPYEKGGESKMSTLNKILGAYVVGLLVGAGLVLAVVHAVME
jgi:hypothetical protein